jgi:hypothetical protein
MIALDLSVNLLHLCSIIWIFRPYGETEEELFANAKKHGVEVHGYTDETWNEEVEMNKD